jgi:methionyl-tRNA synthetase
VEGKCPDHLAEPEWIEEENYFFKMSLYQEWLIQHIRDHPDFVRPERYKNEALSFLKDPLKDLCISRPRTRLPWGIPLPFDEKYVTYVWFDALVNYISAIGYPDGEKFKKFWPHSNHFIAKDILKPHAIYWPCMLKAAGIEPYRHLNVHGYWSLDKHKISKSLGNVVAPLDLSRQYGVDAFRYFLLKDMTFGLDSDFGEENLVKRFNSDLANDFGNLVKRITEMIGKYCDSRIPEPGDLQEPDKLILSSLEDLTNSMTNLLDELKFNDLLERIMSVVRSVNKYINDQAPWDLYKKKDFPRLHTVLHTAGKLAVSCANLLSPVMPGKSAEVFDQFGISKKDEQSIDTQFKAGNPVKTGETLFPKVEKSIDISDTEKSETKDEKLMEEHVETAALVEYEDFAKVKLATARILAAERVPKTDKLMRMDIDLGFEKRQIVAGIAEHYAPEDLVGRTIVVVENLKPKKMKGLESRGMLLAAHGKEVLSLVTVDRPVEPGSPIS